MKLEITTSGYNERRYGRPYIAQIDFSTPKGEPRWGDWIGQPGTAGLLVIDVEPGDIVMRGQHDTRGHNGAPSYGQVLADGTVAWYETKAEAYLAAQTRPAAAANPLAGFTLEQLRAEIARRESCDD